MADTFDVTGIVKSVAIEPGRGAGPAMQVEFVTKPHGIAGSVIIPASSFTLDEAERVVRAQAAILESVIGL